MYFGPAINLYIQSLSLSVSEEMLKLTIIDLCVRDILEFEKRMVQLSPSDNHKFKRYFFVKGTKFNEYHTDSLAEKLILSAFEKVNELRIDHLSIYVIIKLEKDTENFKKLYVRRDAKQARLVNFFWLTKRGRAIRREVKEVLTMVEKNATNPNPQIREIVVEKLRLLEGSVFMLSEETIEIIKNFDTETKNLDNLLMFFNYFDSFINNVESIDYISIAAVLVAVGVGVAIGGVGGAALGLKFGGGAFGGGGAVGAW